MLCHRIMKLTLPPLILPLPCLENKYCVHISFHQWALSLRPLIHLKGLALRKTPNITGGISCSSLPETSPPIFAFCEISPANLFLDFGTTQHVLVYHPRQMDSMTGRAFCRDTPSDGLDEG
ncbi:hypothetical protein CEXT_720151 [Caerostris extrusa]|uniref:Uncharacterized protein n=1 Tax=Caerostris extrusa TaxID=172846 RepID=A0AAV4SXK0_CAEEX|nr:hypothetical protein CEXT_720151 [Caerostris extrusa]